MKITTAEILQIVRKLSVKPHKKGNVVTTPAGSKHWLISKQSNIKRFLKRTEEEINYF